jgi:catechol 2,3-dioxygenase-like lactoylglutathione lyase family enzyme
MATSVFFAAVPVKDFQAGCAWYQRFFGCAPDMRPNEIEAAWRLLDVAWMYVIQDANRAGNALLTHIIDDLDQRVAELSKRGFEPSEVEDVPSQYRKVSFRDPEGNTFAYGQVFG